MNEIEPYMDRVVNNLMEAMSKDRKLNTSESISKSLEYITKNYEKDITLEDVAKAVALSSFYFSKLFKSETGENFIDYLTRFRMTAAETLLKDKRKKDLGQYNFAGQGVYRRYEQRVLVLLVNTFAGCFTLYFSCALYPCGTWRSRGDGSNAFRSHTTYGL